MALALYRQAHPDALAASAGTIVDAPGQTLADAHAVKTITAMKELGIDVSDQTRTQLTPDMLNRYDRVIVMAEPANTPDWLKVSPKAEFWDILDPKDYDQETARRIRDDLRTRVAQL